MLGFVILLSVPLLIYLFKVSPEKRAIKSGKEGEKRVSRILRRHGFRVFDDLIFKENGRTVQIDHIAVSQDCLLIVETKNHGGLISGCSYEKSWRQITPAGRIYTFYNPVWQNYGHLKAVEELLETSIELIPVVVFASDPVLNVGRSDMLVISADELDAVLKEVKAQKPTKGNPKSANKDVIYVCERIKRLNCNSRKEFKLHIKSVRSKQRPLFN